MARRDEEPARREVPLVRIFLSSPGDVAEERTLARQLIDSELPKLPSLRGRLALELIAWDDPAAQIPMLATETPQELGERGPAAAGDLRHRHRHPVVAHGHAAAGQRAQAERRALPFRHRVGVRGRGQLAPAAAARGARLPADGEAKGRAGRSRFRLRRWTQFQRVEAFFARFRNADGSLKGGINEYATPSDFKALLRQHLEEMLYRRLQPSADGVEPPPIAAEIPAEYYDWLRRSLEKVELLGAKEGRAVTLNHVYVPALTRPAPAPAVRKRGRKKQREGGGRTETDPAPPAPRPGVALRPGPGRRRQVHLLPMGGVAEHRRDRTDPSGSGAGGLRGAGARRTCAAGCRCWCRCASSGGVWTAAAANEPGTAPIWRRRWPTGWTARRRGGLTGAPARAHLNAGSAFLLFDGLDEVPVSDTRDRVTVYPRDLLLSGLADALPDWQKAGNRILLTSRPYGLDEAGLHRLGLPSAPLEPLPEPLQDLFVARWFHTLDKAEQTPGLIETIRGRDDLAPLVENPMLLTALCVLYDSGGRLPEDRYDLYKSIVGNVLYHRYPGDASERDPVERRLEAIALRHAHRRGASAPRLDPGCRDQLGRGGTPARPLRRAEPRLRAAVGCEPAVRREELLTRSGLLLPRPNERAAFYHLSFQEFLAAAADRSHHATTSSRCSASAARLPSGGSTLLFLFAAQIAIRDARWGLGPARPADRGPGPGRGEGQPGAGGVHRRGARAVPGQEVCACRTTLKEGFRRLALDAIDDEIELQARQALGLCLGRLGDPRIRDLRDPARLRRGAGRHLSLWRRGEAVEIAAPFRIGRYPVTNGQYQAFIDDGGYRDRRWWSDAGWKWLQEEKSHRAPFLARPALERPEPARGGRQLLGGRGVLRLGRRPPAAGRGMGSRRPRPRGPCISLGQRLAGRHLQYRRGRPRRHLAGRAVSPRASSAAGHRGSGRQRLGVVRKSVRSV